jgi:oligosaccharide repeat unit polymerase
MLAGAGVLLPTLLLIQLSRYGYSLFNAKQVATTLTRLRVFALGYLAVFATWFEDGGWRSTHPSLGTDTFAGVFDLAGLKQRLPGIYPIQIYLTHDRIPNNVYTIFRSLIEDFTLLGALAAVVALGFIAGFAFARVRRGWFPSIPILAAFYAVTLFGALGDLFAYNTMIAAWLLFAAYMGVTKSGTRALVARRSAIS